MTMNVCAVSVRTLGFLLLLRPNPSRMPRSRVLTPQSFPAVENHLAGYCVVGSSRRRQIGAKSSAVDVHSRQRVLSTPSKLRSAEAVVQEEAVRNLEVFKPGEPSSAQASVFTCVCQKAVGVRPPP